MASNIPTEAVDIHNALVLHLREHVVDDELLKLKQLFNGNPLTRRDIASINDIYGLFDCLMREEKIAVGNYRQLVQKLQQTNPNLARHVKDKETEIKHILDGGPSHVNPPTTNAQAQQQSAARQEDMATALRREIQHLQEIHADLRPMIEQTKAMINQEKKEKKFYSTKGFCDAKEKLQQNKVVVIKGNTGDGKTAIAVQLLHELSQDQQAGQLLPLKIHNMEKLDLLTTNSKCITFIDDIFGEKDVCKEDINEWNKRLSNIKSLFANVDASNFLIITLRNEVFNSLGKGFCETIFTESNIIDLSIDTYKVEEEKRALLNLYKPENFSWTEKEIENILTCAPNIGFPQCCQLFYNSPNLQKEGSSFFKKPFHFLNEALSKLPERSALLYLFLNNGFVRVKDLDPNSQNVNKELLEEAFDINLIPGEDDSTELKYKKKVTFVKESLKKLSGFLVMTRKHWRSGEDVYRFHHDSIYVAVALLYGEATPVGYIQNCPSKCLSYLTTSESATNMIGISSDHYTVMCERLLQEFECKKWYETSVGSLDVWKDPVFVKRFVNLLNEKKNDKLAVLNKACRSGAEECALYLLSEGVKPDKDTHLWSLVGRHRNDGNKQLSLLKEIVVYMNDETKLSVLNKACWSGAEECALYLLSESVKPNKATDLWSLVRGRHLNDGNKQLCLLKKIVVYMNDETKLSVLNKACESDAEECVLYLLPEGVKPNKATDLWTLVRNRHRNDGNKQLCLLKKIVVYLNDETKLDVLNGACGSGAEECALYLLSEGVKPDKYTDLWSLVRSRHRNDGNKQLCLLKEIVVYLNDDTKLAVLNKACWSGAEECALYLLCEERVKPDKDTNLWSLVGRHRNDGNKQLCLLKEIVVYLNDETKLAVLNGACRSGAEECALYLLSEGVKPNKATDLWSLVRSRHENDGNKQVCLLKAIVVYMNDKTKLAVLNEACWSGAEECALYLLSEGVKPDKYTALPLVTGHWNDGNKQLCLLKKIVVYMNDKTKLDVLNEACWSGAAECVLYLLSEVVKPNKATDLWSLVDRHRNDGNKQLCLLKEIVVYMNDKTKLDVLNEACWSGAEECALYLLSEGVKPDKYTYLWSLVDRHRNDGNKQLCLLKKLVVYMNVETKLVVLNKACGSGAEECALYLLCEERVKPDKDTVFRVVVLGGSIELLRKLLEYDVTSKARDGFNNNVLHVACLCGREDMVTLLCDTYPHLVHDTNVSGETPLHFVAVKGSVGLFQTMERIVLNSLYRDGNQQTKCESVDGCVVHKYCVCAQYMSQLVDDDGWTVLHHSCSGGLFVGKVNRGELCLYLCRSYPGLIPIVDVYGQHCLHYIARCTTDVDVFKECETCVKQYVESTGRMYDVTTILDNDGNSVLDGVKEVTEERAKHGGSENNPLLEHLVKVFGK